MPINSDPIYAAARELLAAKPRAKADARTRTKNIVDEMLDPANGHSPEEVEILRQASEHLAELLKDEIDRGFGPYIHAAIDDETSGITYTRLEHAISKFLLAERSAWRRDHEGS